MIEFRQWEMRLIAAFFLLVIEVIFDVLAEFVRVGAADWYFALCGGGNLLAILLLGAARNTNFIADLQKLNFVSLLVQFSGWVLYECYFEPTAYNTMILALTSGQVLRLLWVDDDIDTAAHFNWGCLCSFDCSGLGKTNKGAV